MIIKRWWMEQSANYYIQREAWYLFGFIPLYVRDLEPRMRRNGYRRVDR
jgi:hypothetical protein